MLSDRHRHLKILLLAGALLALCAGYARHAATVAVGFARCMEDPVARDGTVLELSLWQVDEVHADRYVVSRMERGVPVIGPPGDLAPGDTVSVVGTFDARTSALREQHREVHRLRRAKYAVGLLGMAVFLAWAALRFRWADGHLALRA